MTPALVVPRGGHEQERAQPGGPVGGDHHRRGVNVDA
jgi:hypothetical protein